jgi:hypothetical protein
MIQIISPENMQVIFLSGHKFLCDGHVMKPIRLGSNALKSHAFLCDGYVMEVFSGLNFSASPARNFFII